MEELNAVTIYWLISIGLLVGYIMDLIMKKKGVGLTGNLVGGVIGSVAIGISMILIPLAGALIYAAVGAMGVLFLLNVFSIHPKERTGARIG